MAAELVFALNLANAALVWSDETAGLSGPAVDLARHIAQRLRRTYVLKRYETAAAVLNDAPTGWDVAFLAVDPARADRIVYSAPYLTLDVACAVHAESAHDSIEAIDVANVRVALAPGAYAAAVRARINAAIIVDVATPAEALGAVLERDADCAVGLVPALDRAVVGQPLRRLAGTIAQVNHALALPIACQALLPAINLALAEWPGLCSEIAA